MRERERSRAAEEAMRREAEALWRVLFDEEPAAGMDVREMFEIIVRQLEVKEYARLHAAERDRSIIWPRYNGQEAKLRRL